MIARFPVGRALAYPDFRRLILATAGSSCGMTGELVVVGGLVYELSGTSFWVGVSQAAFFLPMLLVGVPAGAMADLIDRRRALLFIELATALTLAAIAALVVLGHATLWTVLAFAFVSGSVRATRQPALLAYAYDVVGAEVVVSALGFMSIATRLGMLVGALVAGYVVARHGVGAAYLMLSGIHVVAALICATLVAPAVVGAGARGLGIATTLREYAAELRQNRDLLTLVVVTIGVEVFGFSFSTALPEMASAQFERGARGLGEMHAARAVGGLIAGMALAGAVNLERRGRLFVLTIIAFGIGLLLLAGATTFPLTLLALALVASLASASDILTQSMMQLSVPDRLRGRAMGVWVFAVGSAPLGHLELGALVSAIGISAGLGLNGGALLLMGVLVWWASPRLWRL